MGEKLSAARAVCFLTALIGIVLVLFPDLQFTDAIPGVTWITFASCLLGVVGISIGAVYQKRFVQEMNLLASTGFQFVGAAAFTAILAFSFETREVIWTAQLVGTMVWLILVLSIGAIALLMFLIQWRQCFSCFSILPGASGGHVYDMDVI